MKRISLQLGMALLTFLIGVGTAWSYMHILQPMLNASQRRPVSEDSIPPARVSSGSASKAVKISLTRSYRSEDGLIHAEFEVVNVSGELLYYRGYSKGENMFWSVRRGKTSTRFSPFCGTGLSDRELLPRESTKFQVVVGHTDGSVEIGFDFLVGEKRLRQTIWSGTVDIRES